MTTFDHATLFDMLPEQYVVFEPSGADFKMTAASEAYLKITGKTRDEVVGKNLFEVFPDTSDLALESGKGELQISLEKVLKSAQPDSTGVIRYDIADHKGNMVRRFWQATHYPIMKDGVCVAIIQSTVDVTNTVDANEQLKLATMKLEEAVVTGLVGSWSWDIKKDIVTADKGLANLFGVPIEQAIAGMPIDIFIKSIYVDDQKKVISLITEVLKSGNEFESEYRTVNADGEIRWVIARGRVERDDNGDPVSFPGVMIDITSRKQAEEDLKESEERFRFMADTMPQLVWITRPDGYHEYYNRHWYEYTGTAEGTTDGEGWNNLFHIDDRAYAQKVWKQSLKTGEPYEIKYRLYHKQTNSYRWVIGRALPHKNDQGEIMKWYGTCTDIDDSIKEIELRKQLEKKLHAEKEKLESRVAERTSQLKLTNQGLREEIKKRQDTEVKLRHFSKELQRSNKELEEFAYVSSHDLQEPLRKIQAFGDLLLEEYGDNLGDGSEYLTRIRSSASRMSRLIEDLLDFSRVSTKKMITSKIDLNDVFNDTVHDLGERIKTENGEIVLDNILPVLNVDETHMRQLFQNMISNGLKFHKPNETPVIHVSYSKKNNVHIFCFKDNGIGIDKKYVDKIFAVFQRLHARDAYEGTGIGLAVCKKIVERYNGTIDVESQLNIGTTFIITLPVGD